MQAALLMNKSTFQHPTVGDNALATPLGTVETFVIVALPWWEFAFSTGVPNPKMAGRRLSGSRLPEGDFAATATTDQDDTPFSLCIFPPTTNSFPNQARSLKPTHTFPLQHIEPCLAGSRGLTKRPNAEPQASCPLQTNMHQQRD